MIEQAGASIERDDEGRRLWVPAFAGTTKEEASPFGDDSGIADNKLKVRCHQTHPPHVFFDSFWILRAIGAQ
jgi:hypothetical protein